LSDGELLTGADGYFGELGHLPLFPRGQQCRCGARGCWETEVGAPAIARAVSAPGQRGEELAAAVRSARARGRGEALAAVAHSLGVGIGNVVNLINPQLVVLGGVLQEVLRSAGDEVRAAHWIGSSSISARTYRAEGEPKLSTLSW